MKTVAQITSSIIQQVFPSSQPEGLEAAHALLFQEGISKIHRFLWDEDLQLDPNVSVIRFCKTQYKCGMTVFDRPSINGVIRRVFVICNEQECDPVYYRQVRWPGPEWLGKRAMRFSGIQPANGAALRLGFSEADAANDSNCGRARSGVWCLHNGNIYLSPWIQSTEKIVVEWEGLKEEWDLDDPLPGNQEFRNTLKLFFQYAHERDYGSSERSRLFSNPAALRNPLAAGDFDVALAEYMHWVREQNKVQRFEDAHHEEPWRIRLGTPYDQCLPPTSSPLVLTHIGNFGQQGYGEQDVASLLASLGPSAILACGTTLTEGYDVAVGQFYHSFIEGYGGIYGDPAEDNGFWPAPGDGDWASGSDLDNFKAFYELPNNERYYDVCLGAIHLFVIDTSSDEPDGVTDSGTQAIWLKAKLALSASPWKVVLMSNLVSWAFKDWGADMVLCNASGFYERLSLSGLPVLKNGLGGNQQTGGSVSASTGSQFLQNRGVGYGAGRLVATRCSLRYEMVSTGGALIDSVQIDKGTPECEGATIATLDSASINDFLAGVTTSTEFTQQVFVWAGDPNGNVMAGPLPSICFDTVNNIWWSKTDGVRSNTGWA